LFVNNNAHKAYELMAETEKEESHELICLDSTNSKDRETQNPHEKVGKQLKKPTQEANGATKSQPTGHREYADDAMLYLGPANNDAIIAHLKRYRQVTGGRQIHLQLKQTEILTN